MEYSGKGRVTANVDYCSLKPANGTHEYCVMTLVTTQDVDIIRFETRGADDDSREVSLRWGPPARTRRRHSTHAR